jgi:hypothetical protein
MPNGFKTKATSPKARLVSRYNKEVVPKMQEGIHHERQGGSEGQSLTTLPRLQYQHGTLPSTQEIRSSTPKPATISADAEDTLSDTSSSYQVIDTISCGDARDERRPYAVFRCQQCGTTLLNVYAKPTDLTWQPPDQNEIRQRPITPPWL